MLIQAAPSVLKSLQETFVPSDRCFGGGCGSTAGAGRSRARPAFGRSGPSPPYRGVIPPADMLPSCSLAILNRPLAGTRRESWRTLGTSLDPTVFPTRIAPCCHARGALA